MRHRAQTKFGLLEPPLRRRPTQRKGDRSKRLRDCNRTRQAREETGRRSRFEQQQMFRPPAIGAATVSAIAISVALESCAARADSTLAVE